MVPLLAALTFALSSGTWPFAYPGDGKGAAVLDLRFLNEKRAGETGFVRVAPDGRGFVRGDGKPLRFWPVCAYGYRLKPEEMAENARFLAKMGVNMVRLHASVSPKGAGKTLDDWDAGEVDRVQRYVAALEKEGIYATISPYWANGGHAGVAASWGLGYGDGADLWGLLFFDERLQKAYKGWVRHLYLDPNPYTGVPLAKDPAVAIAQVQNEDSLLFWTLQSMRPAAKATLGKRMDAWLAKRYGSVAAGKARWLGPDGKVAGGDAPLLDTWILTQPQMGGMKARADDQMAFLIDTQRGFYAQMDAFYKEDLGYRGLTNACNWITADPVRQNDAERYTYGPTDVVAVNRYTNGGLHKGPNEGWRIDEGDFLSDRSALFTPRELPTNLKQVVGHPTVVTEGGWVNPLGYQAEGPLLCAAYESLTGIQGLYWFALGATTYDPSPTFDFVTFPDGGHPLKKWEDSVPALVGQFPAAALLYRMGYVRQGAPVVHEERTRAQLDDRDVPVIAEDPSYDPNHNGGDARAGTSRAKGADPLAFLVGPVEVKYDGDPSKTVVKDLSACIQGEKVRSETGELTLDYGKGLFRIDAPKAQAVAGFLGAAGGAFRLKDVMVESTDDYATVTVVALDDRPITTSKRLLVQVGTVVRPTGWRQEPAVGENGAKGWKVVSTGHAPWAVRDTNVTLTVANPGLRRATLLDASGRAVSLVPVKSAGGKATLRLPSNALYVVIEP